MAVFILEDALYVWTNLGKQSLFVWLFVSSVKTGTRRIIRLEELSSVVRLERRTTEDSSSRRMCLLPVFTLETNNEYLPKFVQTDNASSCVKMTPGPGVFGPITFSPRSVYWMVLSLIGRHYSNIITSSKYPTTSLFNQALQNMIIPCSTQTYV